MGFGLLNLFLLVPFAGHVLNGFSYVSNRWIWAYGMMIAYILVKAYPELFTLTVQGKEEDFYYAGGILCTCFVCETAGQSEIWQVYWFWYWLCLRYFFWKYFSAGKISLRLIVALLVVSILLNVSYQYSYEKDYLSEFAEKGEHWRHWSRGRIKRFLQPGILQSAVMISMTGIAL